MIFSETRPSERSDMQFGHYFESNGIELNPIRNNQQLLKIETAAYSVFLIGQTYTLISYLYISKNLKNRMAVGIIIRQRKFHLYPLVREVVVQHGVQRRPEDNWTKLPWVKNINNGGNI